ncbi:arylsulfatase [Pyrenophora seminiperda CCB06]|uniref:Arylsulfatase n=1 Tax=Pyrenophora seminiperda CCB06 TaxID=1302712 RepID=A0A3M7MGZ2_9PLEO|nr:arylsulfatase [Pyrenophora seminiperda CCB06]
MFSILALTAGVPHAKKPDQKRPNTVFILSDDQDRRLGSTDFQSVLQREIFAKGVEFTQHYGTTAQCCPARASILRGQFSHNTNITHVNGPGGNYDKWLASKQDEDYLPLWLKQAGYRTEYVGKFMNGYNTANWADSPKHWDWMDTLIDPYTTFYNVPVLSQNGQRPTYYKGFHSTDVIRIKANANWNPADEFQRKKGSWLRNLPRMNASAIDWADFTFRSRAQALQGVDEIIEDVVRMLEDKGIIDNTYIVYTADNGYHIGQNRAPAGKALFYAEDTNLPFAVRGPGIPPGGLPSTHIDLAPTFLDIAGLPSDKYPSFLDGASLLAQWQRPHQPSGPQPGNGNARETLNIGFWGLCVAEAPSNKELGGPFLNNTYKAVRILGDDGNSWLFTKWCTGDVEMYHTATDPWELHNIADSQDPYYKRAPTRLNAILMLPEGSGETLTSFEDAMAPRYDGFFDTFPRVSFQECLQVQSAINEAPFYPALSSSANGTGTEEGLGRAFRDQTDHFVITEDTLAITDGSFYGDQAQGNAELEELYANARDLTDGELGVGKGNVGRRWDAGDVPDLGRYGWD